MVKAGFWSVRGDRNDAEPRRALAPSGPEDIDALDLRRDWLVALSPPAGATLTLGEL